MKHKSYKEIKTINKMHHAELAESVPDVKAVERFHDPPYQAARMIQAQGIQAGSLDINVRWIDLINYMIQHVEDGSIQLTDKVPADLFNEIGDRHMDVTDYLASKYDIRKGVCADGQNDEGSVRRL